MFWAEMLSVEKQIYCRKEVSFKYCGHKHRFSSLSSQHSSYKVIRLPYGTFQKFVLLYINFHKAIVYCT